MSRRPGDVRDASAVEAALTRYRVMAYVVGVWLLLLVGIAMPVKYLAEDHRMVSVVGPVHGLLYIGYALTCFDLASRRRWSLSRMVLMLLAGAVPALSFIMERKITGQARHPETHLAGASER